VDASSNGVCVFVVRCVCVCCVWCEERERDVRCMFVRVCGVRCVFM